MNDDNGDDGGNTKRLRLFPATIFFCRASLLLELVCSFFCRIQSYNDWRITVLGHAFNLKITLFIVAIKRLFTSSNGTHAQAPRTITCQGTTQSTKFVAHTNSHAYLPNRRTFLIKRQERGLQMPKWILHNMRTECVWKGAE